MRCYLIYVGKSHSNKHEYMSGNKTFKGLISYLVHCKGLCYREKDINAAYILDLNSKCTSCEIAFNTDEYRCYCCSSRLRKRSTRANRSNLLDQKVINLKGIRTTIKRNEDCFIDYI